MRGRTSWKWLWTGSFFYGSTVLFNHFFRMKVLAKELNLKEKTRKKVARAWKLVGKTDGRFEMTLDSHVAMMRPLPFDLKLQVTKVERMVEQS
jgi:hypothetical protein